MLNMRDEVINHAFEVFRYKRGGKNAGHLLGVLDYLDRKCTNLALPSWEDCCMWLHDQSQIKTFRANWARCAEKYSCFQRIGLVRITERGGLSPTPTITWQWSKHPMFKRQLLKS